MEIPVVVAWGWLYVLMVCWREAQAHGRLMEPPLRSSARTYSFDTSDNQGYVINCGRLSRRWTKSNENPWDQDQPQPKPLEPGGKSSQGVIVHQYAQNDTITINAELEKPLQEYFQFRICDKAKETTRHCFDKQVFQIDGRETTQYYARDGNQVYKMKYRLPERLKCAHCVLQWRHVIWGPCGNGTKAMGCGAQEEFMDCADISIGERFMSTRRPTPKYSSNRLRRAIRIRFPKIKWPKVHVSNAASSYRYGRTVFIPHGGYNYPITEETVRRAYSLLVVLCSLFLSLVILGAIYLFYYRAEIDLLARYLPAWAMPQA